MSTAENKANAARDSERAARIGVDNIERAKGMIEGLGIAATMAHGLGLPGMVAATRAEMFRLFPARAEEELERRGLLPKDYKRLQ
jgi:hypothetical protein